MANKRPSYKAFEGVAAKCQGNISKIAVSFGVYRGAVYRWIEGDPRYREVVEHYKGQWLDTCVDVAKLVSVGKAERDENGNFVGWIERPDPSMLRYFMSTLGRKEGYGEDPPEKESQNALEAIAPPMIVFEK